MKKYLNSHTYLISIFNWLVKKLNQFMPIIVQDLKPVIVIEENLAL